MSAAASTGPKALVLALAGAAAALTVIMALLSGPGDAGAGEARRGDRAAPEAPATPTAARDEPPAIRAVSAPTGSGRLHGRVVAGAGALPPQDVELIAVDRAGAAVRATPDAQGRYELEGLAPGSWVLTCKAAGHRTEQRPVVLGPTAASRREDFELAPLAELRVRLTTPDGRPFWSAAHEPELRRARPYLWALATREAPGERVAWTPRVREVEVGLGRLRGRAAELAPEEVGSLELEVDPPLCVSLVFAGAVLDTRLLDEPREEVGFVLAPEELRALLASVRVRPVEAVSGEPVRGADFRRGQNGGALRAEAQEDGSYLLPELPPGPLRLQVDAPGFAPWSGELALEAGRVRELGDVPLEQAASLSLRVTGPDGAPRRAGFLLARLNADGRAPVFDRRRIHRSDAEGRLSLEDLAPGHYLLRSLDPGEAGLPPTDPGEQLRSGLVRLSTGPEAGAGPGALRPLQLVPATSLELVPPSPLPPGCRFRLLEGGYALREGSLRASGPVRLHAPPGTYRLELTDARGELRTAREVVLAREPVTLRLEL
jgi:hypothetical protein